MDFILIQFKLGTEVGQIVCSDFAEREQATCKPFVRCLTTSRAIDFCSLVALGLPKGDKLVFHHAKEMRSFR